MSEINVSKKFVFKGHGGAVYALCEGPQSHLFFSAGSDKYIALWNLETGEQEKFAAQMPAIVYALCYLKEKNILLTGTSSGAIHVIDLKEKKEIKILQHHTGAIFDIKLSRANSSIYVSSLDGSLSLINVETFSFQKKLNLCAEKVRRINLNEEETQLVVCCGDGTIRIIETQHFSETKKIDAHQFSSNVATFHPDGTTLISGGKDAHLNFWDIKNNYALIQSIPAHNYAIYQIVFSLDKKLFATASRDKTIKLWNAETLQLLLRVDKEKYEGHSHSVNDLWWSHHKNYLISTGDDRNSIAWKIDY